MEKSKLMTIDRTDIRPIIKLKSLNAPVSIEENFQNNTLRPIIKMKHDLLVQFFMDYIYSKKCRFDNLTQIKQEEFIHAAFKKDNSFKSELKGLVIGHFTVSEFTVYCKNKSDFNKRILTMIQERILSVLHLF